MARTLKGKRILLTGASTGIGRELARILGAKGAKLALVARQIDKLKEAAGTTIVLLLTNRWGNLRWSPLHMILYLAAP